MSYVRVTLKADGKKLTGSLNELKFDGTIDGDKIAFTATRPNGDVFGTFEGIVHGDQMSGTALWRKTDKVEWTAKRPRARQPASHSGFRTEGIPSRVLRRDSSRTPRFPGRHRSHVDRRCRRHRSERRAAIAAEEIRKPVLFISKARFRATLLVVKLNKLRLNRDSAGSGDRIVGFGAESGLHRRNEI